MKTNTRPSYYVKPYVSTITRQAVPGRFTIMEVRGTETNHIADMSNQGDRLNNILKRGIPLEDARNLFYQMD